MTNQISPAKRDEIELAGSRLTKKQRSLVDNLFTPGINQEEAAVLAGYASNSAHVAASRTLRLPHVLEYLDVCVNGGIKSMAIGAALVVKDLSDTAKSPLVRLQAAQDILNRSGHQAEQKPMVSVGSLTVNIDLS
jgi:hypothetical protein